MSDTRISTDGHTTETIQIVGPSEAELCEHCADEPAEFVVRTWLESDLVTVDSSPLDFDLCGTCLARLQKETKEQNDVTIKLRGKHHVRHDANDRNPR